MNDQAIINRESIARIRSALNMGQITFDEARKMAEPIVASINERSREIAKKYGAKPQLVDFHSLMR